MGRHTACCGVALVWNSACMHAYVEVNTGMQCMGVENMQYNTKKHVICIQCNRIDSGDIYFEYNGIQ